jgi:predicted thioredoxin/glutaredoxin
MARMGVMSTPALAIDGTLVLSGKVPSVDQVKRLLHDAA